MDANLQQHRAAVWEEADAQLSAMRAQVSACAGPPWPLLVQPHRLHKRTAGCCAAVGLVAWRALGTLKQSTPHRMTGTAPFDTCLQAFLACISTAHREPPLAVAACPHRAQTCIVMKQTDDALGSLRRPETACRCLWQVQIAEARAQQEAHLRLQHEEKMKDAFIRGVCALNLEVHPASVGITAPSLLLSLLRIVSSCFVLYR